MSKDSIIFINIIYSRTQLRDAINCVITDFTQNLKEILIKQKVTLNLSDLNENKNLS